VVMEDYADHRVRHSRRDVGALLISRLVTTRCAMSTSRTPPSAVGDITLVCSGRMIHALNDSAINLT
jgi:hypothetical protein